VGILLLDISTLVASRVGVVVKLEMEDAAGNGNDRTGLRITGVAVANVFTTEDSVFLISESEVNWLMWPTKQ
jgi:hypothetical protein